MKKKACFNCDDFNHLAYDCRKRRVQRLKRELKSRTPIHKVDRGRSRPVMAWVPKKGIVEGVLVITHWLKGLGRSCDQAGSLAGKRGSRATVHLNLGTEERLWRPFLRTARALIDVHGGDFILEEIETFLRTPNELSNLDDDHFDIEGDIALIENLLNEDPSSNLPPKKNDDLKQVDVTMTKPSIEEPPEPELKDLPSHLEYAF
nr:reverse transcriptase domain-containing protein [Tanacetum cinerariifolium]